MMITAVKNTGTTTGGTSHEAKVAERSSLIPLGVSEDWVI
jgi:hypothetical protein